MGIRTMVEVVRAAMGGRKEEAEGVVLVDPADGVPIGGAARALRSDPLGRPATARQVAAGAASASVQLTEGITRVTLYARGADIRYALGAAAPAAGGASHYLAIGERVDIAVPSAWYIAAIRAGTVDGTLEITELA